VNDFTHHVKSPPLPPLLEVIGRLERAGIEVALGGSGLLAALGLSDTVRDWDLTTEAEQPRVRECLADLDTRLAGPGGVHADHKVMLPALEIECICRFAFHVDGAIVRIPTVVTRRWRGVPVASPEAWAIAYAVLGRAEKSERLFAWLEACGPDATIVARLLEEPLPAQLGRRLADITSRNT
jgi:hypothetical protein